MKKISRLMTNICSDKLQESKDFYISLFDFNVDYDSDWFVHLISKDKQLELGIIDKNNEIVHKDAQQDAKGFYMTFVVDNVDEFLEVATSKKFEIVEEPTNTFYGQRRLLLKDPNGILVDISAPIPNFQFG